MRVVLDTNILVRSANPSDPDHGTALRATQHLRAAGHELVLLSQSLYEFWVVMTRPAKENGLGLPTAAAAAELLDLHLLFTVIDDTPAVRPEWERLVLVHSVIGKAAHDARVVAAMNVHGLLHVLTFNVRHFPRFPGVTVLDPAAVAPSGP